MMRLHHGGPAGHSASVLIMLAEKGLEFKSVAVDLGDYEQHGESFLAVNPAGQVPVLEADARRLTEAFFILLYLDERYPDPPLGGADPHARYLAQKWGKYVETLLAPNLAVVAWSMRGTAPDAEVRAGFARLPLERQLLWAKAIDGFRDAEVETSGAAIAKTLGRIDEDLADRAWLAGADYSLADIAVFPHVVRARALGFDISDRIADWLGNMGSRPAVVEALSEASGDVATMGPERGRWG